MVSTATVERERKLTAHRMSEATKRQLDSLQYRRSQLSHLRDCAETVEYLDREILRLQSGAL